MVEILSSRLLLRPADYQKTLAFYRDALGLAVYREYPGGTVFFAGQGLIEIAGHRSPVAPAPAGRPAADIWLQVRDIATARAQVEAAGVRIARDARTEPWGLIEMWLTDPDGVPVVLVEVPAGHPLRSDQR
ncbi:MULTISPECIES: VOC family protein [Gordonia]|uniref:VOC family protein n=1 Tax=Gordonia TaxID=2053 RepID=UPI0025BE5595|nr:VOC family protein [Gordonia sp. UBA5067]